MNKDFTEAVIVLDRSGSMQSIRTDMEGGLDRFFDEQKKLPGRCSVTLVQFDDKYEIVYAGRDIKDVPKAELVPRGSTALLDALGRTINAVGARLAKTPEADRPGQVIFLVITDGQENSSREFNRSAVKAMIRHQTDRYNWQFVYLGANQDAIAEGASIGIAVAQNYVADSKGTDAVISNMSEGLRSYRAGGGYKTS